MIQSDSGVLARGALSYDWSADSFLRRDEAEYALEQLWRLCGGQAEWEGPPVVSIGSVDRTSVLAMHTIPPGKLPWLPLAPLLPTGVAAPFDTDELPGLCLKNGSSGVFGLGNPFPLDLVAATFLCLSRWEEVATPTTHDQHGRARAEESLAARQGFLMRPILDEWAWVLSSWIRARKPAWTPKFEPFRISMSHDVDQLTRFPRLSRVMRAVLARIFRDRSTGSMWGELKRGLEAWVEPLNDPYVLATQDQMTIDEAISGVGTFNFMTATQTHFDEGYRLDTRFARILLDELRCRGHRIGWHPSYNSATNRSLFEMEKERMDSIHGSSEYGGRHHYLRWKAGVSWELWEEFGLQYDSSVYYAEAPGFRAGTCRPFQCFSIPQGRPLRLREEPLVLMDSFDIPAVRWPIVPKVFQLAASKGSSEPSDGFPIDRTLSGRSPSTLPDAAELILRRARSVYGQPVVLFHNATWDRVESRQILSLIQAIA